MICEGSFHVFRVLFLFARVFGLFKVFKERGEREGGGGNTSCIKNVVREGDHEKRETERGERTTQTFIT